MAEGLQGGGDKVDDVDHTYNLASGKQMEQLEDAGLKGQVESRVEQSPHKAEEKDGPTDVDPNHPTYNIVPAKKGNKQMDPEAKNEADSEVKEALEKERIFDELSIESSKAAIQRRARTMPISADELTEIKHLSSGHFGITYTACYTPKKDEENPMDVVIKVSKDNHDDEDIGEINIFCQLKKSANVLPILGLCKNFVTKALPTPRLAIITPFQKRGDLRMLMKQGPWAKQDLINIVLGMARSIQQLHAQEIIHRDIAPRNYLVSDDGHMFLTDFGLSRNVEGDDVQGTYYFMSPNAEVPWRSAAPEILTSQKCGKKSDVWMFGTCVWWFVNKREPFLECRNSASLVMKLIQGANKLVHPEHCPEVLCKVIDRCLEFQSSDRPTMDEVIQTIILKHQEEHRIRDEEEKKKHEEMLKLEKGREREEERKHQAEKAPPAAIVVNPDGSYVYEGRGKEETHEEPKSAPRGLHRLSCNTKLDKNGKVIFDRTSFERLEQMKIHNGRCEDIQKGFLKNGEPVVLTFIDTDCKQTMRELDSFPVIPEHDNVLQLIGTLRDGNKIALVTSLHDDDLLNYIKGPKCDRQEWNDISVQMSNGLNHLHIHGIVHRDVALRNFLVKYNKRGVTVRFCDFELSRVLGLSKIYHFNKRLPIPWAHAAYEVSKFGWFGLGSDVYSFGIAMWELFSGGLEPYGDHRLTRNYVLEYLDRHSTVTPLLGLDDIPPKFKLLIECCTNKFADKRPTMADITLYLASSGGHLRVDKIPEYFQNEIRLIYHDRDMPQSLPFSDLGFTAEDIAALMGNAPM